MKNIKHRLMIIYMMTFYMKFQLRCIVSNYTDHSQSPGVPIYPPGPTRPLFCWGGLMRCFPAELLLFRWVNAGSAKLLWVCL